MIGVAMFGSTVYLSQYFQVARGMSPTHAGLMSIAMVGGLLGLERGDRPDHQRDRAVEALPGRRHGPGRRRPRACSAPSTRPPAWSRSAPSWRSSASASARPCRTSCSRSRTTSRCPTWAPPAAVVAFFRSMGGSVGVSVLGAVLSYQVADKVASGLAAIGIASSGTESHAVPDLSARCPARCATVFEHAFGEAFGEHLPDRRPVRGHRADLRPVHPRGPAADLQPRGRGRGLARGRRRAAQRDRQELTSW